MSGCYKRVNFYDLCRLCAQNIQKSKAKIFEPDGQKIQLQSKIKKCLSITVNEDDFLPKVVCLKCIKQLEVCNAFREECLNSETMLSSYFKNYRDTEDFKKSGKVYIKDTVKSDVSTDSSQPLGNKVDSSSKIPKAEPINVPPAKAATTFMHKPEVCPKILNQPPIFTSNQNFANKKVKLNQDMPPQSIPQIQTMQLPYSIDVLNEALKKAVQQLPKDILNKVIVNSNGEVINLSPPDPLTLDPSNIINGLTSVIKNKSGQGRVRIKQEKNHLSVQPSIIKIDLTEDDNIQDIPMNKYSSMSYHKNGQSNGQPVVQSPTVIFPVPQFQNNNFTSVQTNNISYPPQTTVNISNSTPTVINVICSNPSESNSSLTSINQSPPSSINMDDLRATNYIPTTAQTQQVPMSKITVVPTEENNKKKQSPKSEETSKIHCCEVCQKTFKRREHLYQHVKLHTGFRPYRCTECNKSFVRKEHLLRHMVLHSGERNYACDICSKSFSRHDNLLKHIRTHNKEPAYTCDVCQKVFIVKHYYDAHRSEQGKCYLPPQIRAC